MKTFEEILDKHLEGCDYEVGTDTTRTMIISAMREACEQVVDKCAEEAKIIYNPDTDTGSLYDMQIVDKASILKIKSELK